MRLALSNTLLATALSFQIVTIQLYTHSKYLNSACLVTINLTNSYPIIVSSQRCTLEFDDDSLTFLHLHLISLYIFGPFLSEVLNHILLLAVQVTWPK